MRRSVAAFTLSILAALVVLTAGPSSLQAAAPSIVLRDLDDRPLDPFLAAENASAIIFLFTSVDCPISNRYAPAVQRLHAEYAAKGVAFWMIYPNPADRPDAIREHLKAFSYPAHALRDPGHALVKLSGVSVTPEAAVFDRRGALAYHGRIDDRYVHIGLERPAATTHDLADAVAATLSGSPVRQKVTPAVGCYISDFIS